MNKVSQKFWTFYFTHKRLFAVMAYALILSVTALSVTDAAYAAQFNLSTYVSTDNIFHSIGSVLQWIGPLFAVANFVVWLLAKDDRKKEAAKWGMLGGIIALILGVGMKNDMIQALVSYMTTNWTGKGK